MLHVLIWCKKVDMVVVEKGGGWKNKAKLIACKSWDTRIQVLCLKQRKRQRF